MWGEEVLQLRERENKAHTYLIVSLIIWAHRETSGLPGELETLPVALPCKTKGLPAAWSIYTPNELTIGSDSGEFPSIPG